MEIKLKELSIYDGTDIFAMIKEIGPGENGFINGGYRICYDEFKSYLEGHFELSRGMNLSSRYVPQTIYWLYINDRPVGIGKLRHHLNDRLKEVGGHIGYTIRPSERRKGYGNILLKELLKEAKKSGVNKVFITCIKGNMPSRKIIERNNGKLQDIFHGICRYWINIDRQRET
ncbi:GNAT family N-acetyltransferase [Clostridium guangxiense]|uniref:GNAT family N-acetyltransferase n=1 Tax=Clostridium guangxiense TaxID=1662055 RepID=UPI001E5ACF52|nr:GNAT family N-acetyltransferase [Clostridium guangxiense]MCD2347374.1 GNAT family N-acetyltransferase [Clostridium guangxiense]